MRCGHPVLGWGDAKKTARAARKNRFASNPKL
jgi:hypothetical protein